MWRRCTDPKIDRYAQYGGRGIRVCARWGDFANFLADMGQPPPGMSLDRKDNDGDYEPENCRWATKKEQSNNKQTSRRVEIDGVSRPITEWIRVLQLNTSTVFRRMKKGMDAKSALLAPDQRPTVSAAMNRARKGTKGPAPCGTRRRYDQGCRCALCRYSNASRAREYRASAS
jgi:hypothetical protein